MRRCILPNPVYLMNKTLSIICYVVAGFFFYTIMILSFVNEPPVSAKLAIMGVFAVPAAINLLIGLHVSRYGHWQRDLGIVLLSAALFTIFLVLTVACMLATPEFTQQFPDNKIGFFSDYVSGTLCIAAFLSIGGWLVWRTRNRETNVAQ